MVVDLPVEDEDLLLGPGVRHLHVGDHHAVNVRALAVEGDGHGKGRARLHRQLGVDQEV